MADTLRDRYPKVRRQVERFVTEDRRVMCNGGADAAIDLSLHPVEKPSRSISASIRSRSPAVTTWRCNLPGTYIQMLRISAARELPERGTPSIQAVRSKIGYEDVAFFRSPLERHTGMTPGDYRTRSSP